jgi:hypothetical protein
VAGQHRGSACPFAAESSASAKTGEESSVTAKTLKELVMTMLHPSVPAADGVTTAPTVPAADAGHEPSRLRGRWPFAAFVAGPVLFAFFGIGAKYFEEDVTDQGALAVYDQVKDVGTQAHISVTLAFIGAFALGLFAQGFVRFLDSRTPAGSGAGTLARIGVTSAVGLSVLIASIKAIYRGGLPDHMDSAMYPEETVGHLYVFVDQLQYVALWPLTFAMAGVVALWFNHKTLPRWYGVFSGLLLVATLLMALVLNLPYFAGLVGPLWIVASGVVVLRHRNRPVGIAR